MSSFSLYQRFRNEGTLSEEDGVPDPRYALPSTVHWMRAIALLLEKERFDFKRATKFFDNVTKRQMTPRQENSVLEHLLLAVHQLAALQALEDVNVQSDIARVASVGWYYGIYAAATAMIAAQDGLIHDNHTKTANVWDRQFVKRGLVLHPFDLRVSTLVKKDAEREIDRIRLGPRVNLVGKPLTAKDAHLALCGYLSGTRGWWGWRIEEEVKSSKGFKELGVENFRTKAAQGLRDARLGKQSISFLHQAIRFRGKANYREALYLAHGTQVEIVISGFVSDMANILEGFLAMAGAFAFKCIGNGLRDAFLEDLHSHRSFSLDHREIWS